MAVVKKEGQIAIASRFDKLVEDSKKELTASTINKTPEEVIKSLKVYNDCVVENLDSKSAYDMIVKGLKELKKVRTGVDSYRKDLTAPATKYQKDLIEFSNKYIIPISDTEKHLMAQKLKYDDLLEAEKNRLFTERAKLLAENGYQLANKFYVCGIVQVDTDTLSDMEQKDFDYYIEIGKKELDRQKAESERLANLDKREKEIAQKEAELNEREAKLNKDSVEVEAQGEAIEKTYDEITKVEESPAETVSEEVKPIETVKSKSKNEPKKDAFGDIFDETLAANHKGFIQCQEKVLKFLSDSDSFGKSIVKLKQLVKGIEYEG